MACGIVGGKDGLGLAFNVGTVGVGVEVFGDEGCVGAEGGCVFAGIDFGHGED